MNPRVSILTNIPAPYRLPVFRELASRVDLQVIFDARSEPNRSWNVGEDLGFRHVYASGAAVSYQRNSTNTGVGAERYLQLRYNILSHLRDFRPEIVISGEMGVRSLQAEIYCRLSRTPLVVWSEGTRHSEGWVSWWKRSVRRHLVRSAARFWTNGGESSALLETYGARNEHIDPGMMAVRPDLFMSDVDEQYRLNRETLRRSLGLHGTTFCFVGEFIPRKGIREYLEALRCLKSVSSRAFSALFVGDGPEREAMEQWGRTNAVPLIITGFRQQPELPGFYAAADVFVLPTLEDNWALVTLEAAFAGLPQIFSELNGATSDLRALGAPGIAVNPHDISSLTGALENYVNMRPERAAHATRQAIARIYGPQACAQRMCASIERGLNLSAGSISGPAGSISGKDEPPPIAAKPEATAAQYLVSQV
jgi:glycosyltransferase involved in cell wall biosynthesis